MSARLLTHDEVSALHDTGEDWSVSDDGGRTGPLIVDAQGYEVAEVDGFDTTYATDLRHARLLARAPALRATALDLFARLSIANNAADGNLEPALSLIASEMGHRGDDLHHLTTGVVADRVRVVFSQLNAQRAASAGLRTELAAAHARIAELERLATGPRSAESDDAWLSRPFAPETLPGWDGDGREVGS